MKRISLCQVDQSQDHEPRNSSKPFELMFKNGLMKNESLGQIWGPMERWRPNPLSQGKRRSIPLLQLMDSQPNSPKSCSPMLDSSKLIIKHPYSLTSHGNQSSKSPYSLKSPCSTWKLIMKESLSYMEANH